MGPVHSKEYITVYQNFQFYCAPYLSLFNVSGDGFLFGQELCQDFLRVEKPEPSFYELRLSAERQRFSGMREGQMAFWDSGGKPTRTINLASQGKVGRRVLVG